MKVLEKNKTEHIKTVYGYLFVFFALLDEEKYTNSLFPILAVTHLTTRGPRPQRYTRGDLLKGFKEKQIKRAQRLQYVFVLWIQERIDHAVLPCVLWGIGAISRQHMIAVPSPQWRHWSPTGQQGRCTFACNNGGTQQIHTCRVKNITHIY